MTEDEQQLDLLGIFHFVYAGLIALFSCIPIFHVMIGLAILAGVFGSDAPPFPGLILMVLGWGFILTGWTLAILIAFAGRCLRRRRRRVYCLVVAALECLFVPLGTILGVFTLIVLEKDAVRKRFAANA